VSYLLDTNVLARLVLPHDPLCPVATAAIDELQQRGERLVVAPQNLIELWAVATRPPEINFPYDGNFDPPAAKRFVRCMH